MSAKRNNDKTEPKRKEELKVMEELIYDWIVKEAYIGGGSELEAEEEMDEGIKNGVDNEEFKKKKAVAWEWINNQMEKSEEDRYGGSKYEEAASANAKERSVRAAEWDKWLEWSKKKDMEEEPVYDNFDGIVYEFKAEKNDDDDGQV
jgi:hypothetical protein